MRAAGRAPAVRPEDGSAQPPRRLGGRQRPRLARLRAAAWSLAAPASPNVRHTIGSSRNRFSRGDRLEQAHCTTRNSTEKMMLTSRLGRALPGRGRGTLDSVRIRGDPAG